MHRRHPGLRPSRRCLRRCGSSRGERRWSCNRALVFDTNSYFAYVRVGPEAVARRNVTVTSWNEKGYARVVSGLAAGDMVVVAGSLQVNELWREAHGES